MTTKLGIKKKKKSFTKINRETKQTEERKGKGKHSKIWTNDTKHIHYIKNPGATEKKIQNTSEWGDSTLIYF